MGSTHSSVSENENRGIRDPKYRCGPLDDKSPLIWQAVNEKTYQTSKNVSLEIMNTQFFSVDQSVPLTTSTGAIFKLSKTSNPIIFQTKQVVLTISKLLCNKKFNVVLVSDGQYTHKIIHVYILDNNLSIIGCNYQIATSCTSYQNVKLTQDYLLYDQKASDILLVPLVEFDRINTVNPISFLKILSTYIESCDDDLLKSAKDNITIASWSTHESSIIFAMRIQKFYKKEDLEAIYVIMEFNTITCEFLKIASVHDWFPSLIIQIQIQDGFLVWMSQDQQGARTLHSYNLVARRLLTRSLHYFEKNRAIKKSPYGSWVFFDPGIGWKFDPGTKSDTSIPLDPKTLTLITDKRWNRMEGSTTDIKICNEYSCRIEKPNGIVDLGNPYFLKILDSVEKDYAIMANIFSYACFDDKLLVFHRDIEGEMISLIQPLASDLRDLMLFSNRIMCIGDSNVKFD